MCIFVGPDGKITCRPIVPKDCFVVVVAVIIIIVVVVAAVSQLKRKQTTVTLWHRVDPKKKYKIIVVILKENRTKDFCRHQRRINEDREMGRHPSS